MNIIRRVVAQDMTESVIGITAATMSRILRRAFAVSNATLNVHIIRAKF